MKRKVNPKKKTNLGNQLEKHANKKIKPKRKREGDFSLVTRTGSTLLDLAISGEIVRGGGIPCSIIVEITGPSSTGKTGLLSEIAGQIQKSGGDYLLDDPEARFNKFFAKMFGFKLDPIKYKTSDTVTELFENIRKWVPKPKNKNAINAIFADSLAALSTELEMSESGDKMGTRRAKEFSEQLRKTTRLIKKKKYLIIATNQMRENINAMFGKKNKATGGKGIEYYSSLILETNIPKGHKIKEKIKYKGKDITRVIGININVEVFKSSIGKPYRSAPITIIFDYGIDDIRQNLQFLKNYTKSSIYTIGNIKLKKSMKDSIAIVEKQNLEKKLREEVINLWEDIESKFETKRKNKY